MISQNVRLLINLFDNCSYLNCIFFFHNAILLMVSDLLRYLYCLHIIQVYALKNHALNCIKPQPFTSPPEFYMYKVCVESLKHISCCTYCNNSVVPFHGSGHGDDYKVTDARYKRSHITCRGTF